MGYYEIMPVLRKLERITFFWSGRKLTRLRGDLSFIN